MTATLPPLPEPDTRYWDEDTGRYHWNHSPEQIRAYGAACAAAEREACAKVCDEQHDRARTSTGAARANACADAIRARKDTE